MIVLAVIGVIAAVVVGLLFVPVGFLVQYKAGIFQAKLTVGFLRFWLKDEKEDVTTSGGGGKEQGIGRFRKKIQPLLHVAGELRRKAVIRSLYLHITCGGPDPAAAALQYAGAWAFIGTLTPVLENTFYFQQRDLSAVYSSEADGLEIECRAWITLRLWQLLQIAVRHAAQLRNQQANNKGGAKQ